MKRKTLELLVACIVLAAAPCLSIRSLAQSPKPAGDSFLKRLDGTWQGEGKTMGMPARLRLSWEGIWGDKFFRLSLKNEMTARNGQTQVFEGLAYYQALGDGKYEATWFDSRGQTFPIKAGLESNALIALWGSPDKEQGRSIYRILEPAKLEVIDEVRQKDGSWREFGRFVVRRD